MKFLCDQCSAKYSIADEKVRGKILKVRCKTCGHIMTVREPRAPEMAGSAAPGPPRIPQPPSQVLWYYSINGESFGPYDQQQLAGMFERGEVGDESYLWNESYGAEWKLVRDVPEFRSSLIRGQEIRPHRTTLHSNTGQIEAIKPAKPEPEPEFDEDRTMVSDMLSLHDLRAGDAKSDLGASTQASSAANPQSPKPSQPASGGLQLDRSQESVPKQRGGDLLRKRLESMRSESDDHVPAQPSDSLGANKPRSPLAKSNGVAAKAGSSQARAAESLKSPQRNGLSNGSSGPSLPSPTPESQRPSLPGPSPMASIGDPEPNDDETLQGNLSLSALAASADSSSTPQQTSSDVESLFASFDEPQEDSGGRIDDDSVPFFDAPRLQSAAVPAPGPEAGATTASLLIQLDQINKEGRKPKVFAGIAAAVLLLGIIGFGGYMAYTNSQKNKQTKIAEKEELKIGRAPVERTYSKKERQIMLLESGEAITAEEAREAYEEAASEDVEEADSKTAPESDEKSKPTKKKKIYVATKTNKKEPFAIRGPMVDTNKRSALDDALKNSKKTDAKAASGSPNIKTGGAEKDGPSKGVAIDDPKKSTKRISFGAARRGPSYSPTALTKDRNKRKQPNALPATLDRKALLAGFRQIRRSVAICRERHTRRGQSFSVGKIYITVKIQPNGSVNGYDTEPSSVKNTEFDRCMRQRRGRWKFPEFSGKPLPVRKAFVIQ